MEGELRQLAEEYAAAMTAALHDVYTRYAGRPRDEVQTELTDRLTAARVPFDLGEVAGYARQISDGAEPGSTENLP